ncbi:hypothetical protein [Pyrobaculum neutrophilum]|uniref:Uncharacterized protein n=1 Tax=Pyrobaculum neutrophilum (strain DSM 2338 / JCM 9278 / NBRC 100436 / V24Sta) TaxID=444157 RepID=B1Y9D9_PYRNV|nr:hypothetical protein [Pyrobaculum neutrophilum]ACB40368.1 conserved hypothetical protein [Pyrobaculum neutrophilum V24Sta]
MDILLEEIRRTFGATDEGKLAEALVVAYRQGGAKAAKAVLHEYLRRLGVDVEDRED